VFQWHSRFKTSRTSVGSDEHRETHKLPNSWNWCSGFGGLEVSLLAFGTQVCRFKPSLSHRIFQGEKILSTPSFGGEVKPSVPCRRFAACKRSLQRRGSRHCQQNYRSFLAHISPFPCYRSCMLWTWGRLAVQVGTSKAQGKYNKPVRLWYTPARGPT
jgi:hypothetical protein